MSDSIAQQISLFRTLIENRRFNDGTLRVLESVLVSNDFKSLLQLRSSLREFMRHESLRVIHEISDKSAEHKLLILDFFVRAFALADDIECCLALRYEALIMRELKSTSNRWLQVSHREWVTFAEHALENRFYSIARKACEKALSSFQMSALGGRETDDFSKNVEIEKIKRLVDVAVISASSRSVQAQAAEYLKKKTLKHTISPPLVRKERQCIASTLFRDGIKKRNVRNLQEHRSLQQIYRSPHAE
ncbi:hypothetical protein LguiA_011932 [Lonicera macranthoides]